DRREKSIFFTPFRKRPDAAKPERYASPPPTPITQPRRRRRHQKHPLPHPARSARLLTLPVREMYPHHVRPSGVEAQDQLLKTRGRRIRLHPSPSSSEAARGSALPSSPCASVSPSAPLSGDISSRPGP